MGRIRGKRNRDQDRYWSIQRRATQEGMVGALDVPMCCFCGQLTPSDQAIWTQGDIVCDACGRERGLISRIFLKDEPRAQALASTELFQYEYGGRFGTATATIQARHGKLPSRSLSEIRQVRQARTVERFDRELERLVSREEARLARLVEREQRREEARLARLVEREQRREARLARLVEREQRREEARLARLVEREQRREARLARLVEREQRRQAEYQAYLKTRLLDWLLEAKQRPAVVVGSGRAAGRQFIRGQKVWQTDIGNVSMARRFAIREKDRKLTNKQARAIRERYCAGGISQAKLAKEYGITQGYVGIVLSGSTYKAAGGPFYWPECGFFYAA